MKKKNHDINAKLAFLTLKHVKNIYTERLVVTKPAKLRNCQNKAFSATNMTYFANFVAVFRNAARQSVFKAVEMNEFFD